MDDLKRKKILENIVFLIIIFFIFLAAYGVNLSIQRQGSHMLKVNTLPKDASVEVNGIYDSHNIYLQPGTYTIKAQKEGFLSNESVIEIKESDLDISLHLVPESKEALSWAEKNKTLFSEQYNEIYDIDPILPQLPFKNFIFSMHVKPGTESRIPLTIYIDTFKGYQNSPINKIRAMGFDPTAYKYKFNIESPF